MGAMILDIFRQNAFNMVSLTAAINKLPYKPTRIGNMGLYSEKGINTTFATIEERDGKLGLLTSQARGTMPQVATIGKRKMRAFAIPHFPMNENVMAEQVQNMRTFGSANQLEAIATAINDRLQSMKNWIDVTREFLRVKSLQGKLYDGDATTVLFDWFAEFGLSQTVIDVDFTAFNIYAAPTAPTTATGAAGALTGDYLYKVTFVTANGETQGGTESATVSPATQKVDLTAIPVGPTGVLYRRIYRTAAGGASGTEKFVAQINDNTTTTYTDNVADASLGVAVPQTNSTGGSVYEAQGVMDMKKDVCTPLIRNIEDALGVTMYDHIHVFCGNTFWDNFVNHPSVIHAYERWLRAGDGGTGGSFFREQQRQQLNRQADTVPVGGFEFGGVVWENYRGHLGNTKFFADLEAYAVPVGSPDVFIEHFAPAPFVETVNTIGLPYYAKQEPIRFNTGVELHSQTNPLPMPTRPGAIIKLLQTNP